MKILLIANDSSSKKILVSVLKKVGLEDITEYSNLYDGLALLFSNPEKMFDLVVFDTESNLVPKEMDSVQLIKALLSKKTFTNWKDTVEKIHQTKGHENVLIWLISKKLIQEIPNNQNLTSFKRPTDYFLTEELIEKITSVLEKQKEERENSPKILLAEDYKHSQIIITRFLKKNGFENVVVAENGVEAVEMVKKSDFDLILMDMQMPIMNGLEATKEIRKMEKGKEIPIIALTPFAMKEDREKCLEIGATDYISKPIDSNEFISRVKYYLGLTVKAERV